MNNKERYLLVFDLDGTLLDDEKNIMPKTKTYLQKLASMGHIIALASGRPPRAMLPYYRELNLSTPLISYNGALISDPVDKSVAELKYFFSKEDVLDFIHHFEEGDIIDAFAENDDTIYLLRENKMFTEMFHREGMNVIYGDFRKTLKCGVYAAVFQYKDRQTRDRSYTIPLHGEEYFIRGWYGIDTISEFGNHSISKASGIQHIQSIYQIDDEHTIAFGDAENDVEMLNKVKYPFAMKNGNKNLIEFVKSVSLEDNNHEGIYLTLKNFFATK